MGNFQLHINFKEGRAKVYKNSNKRIFRKIRVFLFDISSKTFDPFLDISCTIVRYSLHSLQIHTTLVVPVLFFILLIFKFFLYSVFLITYLCVLLPILLRNFISVAGSLPICLFVIFPVSPVYDCDYFIEYLCSYFLKDFVLSYEFSSNFPSSAIIIIIYFNCSVFCF